MRTTYRAVLSLLDVMDLGYGETVLAHTDAGLLEIRGDELDYTALRGLSRGRSEVFHLAEYDLEIVVN